MVRNPPFIAGKDLREELGDGYTEALWASRGKSSDSIDYVMYWWDHAATLLARKDGKALPFRVYHHQFDNPGVLTSYPRKAFERGEANLSDVRYPGSSLAEGAKKSSSAYCNDGCGAGRAHWTVGRSDR